MAQFDADFFKQTVFLPKTDFPMRGALPQKEPEIQAFWDEIDLFAKLREQSKHRQPFILHWGPPYANGHAHIGHAFTKILKDVVNKSRQMLEYDAHLVPGWDCHGLPIEWKIEEKYRKDGKDKDAVPPLEFRQECREFAQHWVDVQSSEFQRLGVVVGNWKKPYLTMTHNAESLIVREIHKFLLNGGLYRGAKPVMWSTVEKTALAEAEVEYKEHKSVTVWVRFPLSHASVPETEGADIVIWTTTPWTLPSNRAIAYGANIDYAVYTVTEIAEGSRVQIGDKLVMAMSLAGTVKETAKITAWEQGRIFAGSALEGSVAAHPLCGQGYDFDVRLLEGDFVTDDAGTGFVHVAPGHGEDDFYLGIKHGVEVTDNVADDGVFRPHVPLFAGMEVYTQQGELGGGNFAVIKAIDDVSCLVGKANIRHEYPHSWRSKAPVIFRTTPQWFISMETNDLRQKALQAISETRWIPAKGEARIRAMIENRPDWCVSRQRSWGVPIALFVHKETGETLKDETVLNRIGDIFAEEGSDAWWARPAQDFLGDAYNTNDFEQIFDIVDVWFESGSTHSFVLEHGEWGLPSPADLYLEGSDQHRGWFHSSLLESCGTRGSAPYKNVLTHGFVLDEKGYKMSKSLGNTVAPQEVIKDYGADILRVWTILSDYSEDVRIGDQMLKNAADVYRRIRNTLRFLLGALDGFTSAEAVDLDKEYVDLPELEKYMLHCLSHMDLTVRGSINDYDFGRLFHKLHMFCNTELSAFYFDIRKDRLYCDRPDLFERRACRTVMAKIFECLVTWLAPVLTFTMEEVWQYRPQGCFGQDVPSVHMKTFMKMPSHWHNEALAVKYTKLGQVRSAVLMALEPKRADKTIGSSLEAHPVITLDEDLFKAAQGVDLAELCITSQVTVKQGDALRFSKG